MIERPTSLVRDPHRAKPRLVIFDDEPALLLRFTRQYSAMGYAVTPVLVENGIHEEIFPGRRVASKPEVMALLNEIKPDCVLSDNSMRNPEAELTRTESWEHPDVVLGTHVMRMAASLVPKPLCALHSGEFTERDGDSEAFRTVKNRALGEARHAAYAGGYEVHPKDREGEGQTALCIHRHFEQQLRGHGRA